VLYTILLEDLGGLTDEVAAKFLFFFGFLRVAKATELDIKGRLEQIPAVGDTWIHRTSGIC
jgi:hypothetical protein